MRVLLVIILGIVLGMLIIALKGKPKNKLSNEIVETLKSVKAETKYDGLNVFSMEIKYDYDLDKLTPVGLYDENKLVELIFQEAAPGIRINYEEASYGCSAFTLKQPSSGYIMGRNYDFKNDTSAMMVLCHPKNGYASIGHAALNDVKCSDPFGTRYENIACLTSPFICLDGINEKGLGIAVLTLDSKPVCHNTGKPVLPTTILIRLVLDRAANVEEAIALLEKYDMLAVSGRDYHFYITDRTGAGCIVEFDCETDNRRMVVTPTRTATNFFIMYKDKVQPFQKNGIYGHGKERYDAIEEVLDKHDGVGDSAVAFEALKAASQEPNPESITSNTQWSIAYDLETLSYEFVYHRRWEDVIKSNLKL